MAAPASSEPEILRRRAAAVPPSAFGLSGERVALALSLAAVAVLCGLPLLLLARTGLAPEGVLSLQPLAEAWESRSVRRALWNSLESGLGSALLATALGAGLALAVGLTDVRAKGALIFCILLPMMIPPHVTAIAWIQALGPGSPVLRWLGLSPELGATHPLYSREGVIALLAIQHSPLVFLAVRAALRTLPREMAEAARVSGASGARVLRRVILPLLAPSLIAGFMLAFVSALGNFGIPALLGIPARYTTLPVLIWRRLASFGPDVLTSVAVIAFLIAAVAVVAVALQTVLQRRAKAALIGPPQPALAWRLGRARPWVEAGLWGLIVLILGLPVVSLFATALVQTYGLPLTWETLTFRHFDEVIFRQSVTYRAFVNSTLVAGAASLVLAALAGCLGWFLARPRGAPRRAAELGAGKGDRAEAGAGRVFSRAFIQAVI
ncbi:MAG: ABC transporter permease subunit, partial [Pseudomonadota bacterium]